MKANVQLMESDPLFFDPTPGIPVRFVQILREDTLPWEDIFGGFDRLYAVTYSLGLSQLETMMKNYKYGEIIVGSPSQLPDGAVTLAAEAQLKGRYDMDRLPGNSYLKMRMMDNTFHLHVVSGSHTKLYLLAAEDGRRRIVMGSANLSGKAFSGSQLEHLDITDVKEDVFQDYLARFDELKMEGVEITKNAKRLQPDGSNLDELPTVKKIIHSREAVLIKEDPEAETDYIDTESLKKWQKRLATAGLKTARDGSLLITADNIHTMTENMKKEENDRIKVEREQRRQLPSFHRLFIDYPSHTALMDGTPLDLTPPAEDVKRDVDNWNRYLSGCDAFTGDTRALKETYWKTLLYMFISPFIPEFRWHARSSSKINSVGAKYPLFLLLRGPKNGGKSTVIETIYRMLTGKHLIPMDRRTFFVNTEKLLPAISYSDEAGTGGFPILFDDINQTTITANLNKISKDESGLFSTADRHQSAVICTSNAENAAPDTMKRVVVFTIDNQITEKNARVLDGKVNDIQKSMGTAFFRAFLKNILDRIDPIVDEIHKDSTSESADAFLFASLALKKTMEDAGVSPDPSFRLFTQDDFMGDKIKGAVIFSLISDYWKRSPENFRRDRKKDILTISFADLTEKEKLRWYSKIENELPPDTAPANSARPIVINDEIQLKYSAMTAYTGLSFLTKKSTADRLLSLFRRK